jgi:hypothetical protein
MRAREQLSKTQGSQLQQRQHRPSIQDKNIDHSLEKCFVLSNAIGWEEISCNEIVDKVENTQGWTLRVNKPPADSGPAKSWTGRNEQLRKTRAGHVQTLNIGIEQLRISYGVDMKTQKELERAKC